MLLCQCSEIIVCGFNYDTLSLNCVCKLAMIKSFAHSTDRSGSATSKKEVQIRYTQILLCKPTLWVHQDHATHNYQFTMSCWRTRTVQQA